MSKIQLHNVCKQWSNVKAVDNVSFSVPEGTLTALLGPSGCGKSTILRMIAGLEEVSGGSITIGGKDITSTDAAKRGISMVFQSYALFPHLNVRENILFGLKVRKIKKGERERRLEEATSLVGLNELLNRKPVQLSGGQRQRVALARTIVSQQPVCLMDEPLSNLDAKLRAQMRNEIRELQQQLGLTVLYVTHDQTEAMTMADQVILLCNGKIEQTGTPEDLYEMPETVFTAKFIGNPPMNIFPSDIFGENNSSPSNGHSHIGIRPEHIEICKKGIPMKIRKVDFLGSETLLYLEYKGQKVLSKISGRCLVKPGEKISVNWPDNVIHRFDKKNRLGQKCPSHETLKRCNA